LKEASSPKRTSSLAARDKQAESGIVVPCRFVSDPTQGYGLYVDWMLQEAGTV